MDLIKFLGISILVLGLAACSEADKSDAMDKVKAETTTAVDVVAETMDKATDKASEAIDAAKNTASNAADAASKAAETATKTVKSKFDTEKFGGDGNVSSAPAPSFHISDNLKEGEYVNVQGEIVKNRELEGVKANPKLRQIPEGMKEGSVEHTMWLLEQPEDVE